MAKYNIFSNGEKINTIVADESFCKSYCEKYSYTYELVEEPSVEIPGTEEPITETEQLRADIDYIAVMTGVEL